MTTLFPENIWYQSRKLDEGKPRAAQFLEGANKISTNIDPYVGLLQHYIDKVFLARGKASMPISPKLELRELLDYL
jgi:hypothetical protein